MKLRIKHYRIGDDVRVFNKKTGRSIVGTIAFKKKGHVAVSLLDGRFIEIRVKDAAQ